MTFSEALSRGNFHATYRTRVRTSIRLINNNLFELERIKLMMLYVVVVRAGSASAPAFDSHRRTIFDGAVRGSFICIILLFFFLQISYTFSFFYEYSIDTVVRKLNFP